MKVEVVRNSTLTISAQAFLDEDNSIVAPLQGATITALFKDNPKRPDSAALITKAINNGIDIDDQASGTFTITVDADELDIDNAVIYFETVVLLVDGTKIRNGIQSIYIKDNVVHG